MKANVEYKGISEWFLYRSMLAAGWCVFGMAIVKGWCI
jgi:hypothetical protein